MRLISGRFAGDATCTAAITMFYLGKRPLFVASNVVSSIRFAAPSAQLHHASASVVRASTICVRAFPTVLRKVIHTKPGLARHALCSVRLTVEAVHRASYIVHPISDLAHYPPCVAHRPAEHGG